MTALSLLTAAIGCGDASRTAEQTAREFVGALAAKNTAHACALLTTSYRRAWEGRLPGRCRAGILDIAVPRPANVAEIARGDNHVVVGIRDRNSYSRLALDLEGDSWRVSGARTVRPG
jgi:hypothetical protein